MEKTGSMERRRNRPADPINSHMVLAETNMPEILMTIVFLISFLPFLAMAAGAVKQNTGGRT